MSIVSSLDWCPHPTACPKEADRIVLGAMLKEGWTLTHGSAGCWMENNPLDEACVSGLLDSTSTAPKLRELGLDTDQVSVAISSTLVQ